MNWKYTTGDIIILIDDNNKYKILNYTRQAGINYYLIETKFEFVEEDKLISVKEIRKNKIKKITKI